MLGAIFCNNNNNLYSDKSIHDTFTVDRTPLAYFVQVMSSEQHLSHQYISVGKKTAYYKRN